MLGNRYPLEAADSGSFGNRPISFLFLSTFLIFGQEGGATADLKGISQVWGRYDGGPQTSFLRTVSAERREWRCGRIGIKSTSLGSLSYEVPSP